MKILVFWDIYWRIWRNSFKKELPSLLEKYSPDFTIVNIENITSWRWPIEKHILEMNELPIDIMTWGDHIFDNEAKIKDLLNAENSKLLRPYNFYKTDIDLSWFWYKILNKNGKRLLVVHLIGQVFMKYNVENPFLSLKTLLEKLKWSYDFCVIDFHREATAEIYGLALFIDSELKDYNVSLLFWTHTHIQTNDELVLDNGLWLIADVWMSWPMYSVIWASFESVRKRFISGIWKWKIEQSLDKRYVVNALYAEIDDENFSCKNIEKIRLRGEL